MKFIQQSDEKDCGPACLAMISNFYGKKVSMARLREYAKTDKLGTNIYGLIIAGKKIGLDLTGIELENHKELKNVNFPLIAHVINSSGYDHFIIIEKLKKNHVYIIDPDKGKIKMNFEDFETIWTKVIITCKKLNTFNTTNDTPSYIKIFKDIFEKKFKTIFLIVIFSLVINIIGIIGAIYFKILTDYIIPSNLLKSLHIISLAILALYLLNLLIDYLRYQMILKLSLKIDLDIMKKYFFHVLHLPMNFFDTRKSGEILQRFTDVSKIREALSTSTVTLLVDTTMIIVGGIFLYIQSPLLLGVSFIFIPLFIIISYFLRTPFEKYNQKVAENSANLNSYLIETFEGSNTIKSYNSEKSHYNKGLLKFDDVLFNLLKLGRFSNIQLTVNNFLKLTITLVILWIGTYLVITNNITLGTLLTFNALIIYYIDPIERLINVQPTLQSAKVAARRIVEIIDLDIEKNRNSAVKIMKFENKIQFKDVTFQYGYRNLVLRNISIDIYKGQKVSIVGESGSGKTTIGKIINGFYKVTDGNVYVDDININNIDLECLRNNIGYVSQDTYLFADSIKNNLLYGSNNIYTEDDMIEACKKAEILDFILELPNKFNTMLEKNGSNISGGQAQRLSLARALIKNPSVLILDEFTSALDSYTEYRIMKNINLLKESGTTIILITHKLSISKDSDNIYVLKNKNLIESGSHEQLLENKQLYYNLWELQN